MAGHTSEKRWTTRAINSFDGTRIRLEGLSERAQPLLKEFVEQLILVEEAYQQMQEIYSYAGGSNTLLAELLFKEEIAARSSPDNVASQEEIDKATDLVNAMTAAHQIYQAANNVVVTQSDRLTEMRRMI
jgi:hypothetical protein